MHVFARLSKLNFKFVNYRKKIESLYIGILMWFADTQTADLFLKNTDEAGSP